MKRKALGRGLSAILSDNNLTNSNLTNNNLTNNNPSDNNTPSKVEEPPTTAVMDDKIALVTNHDDKKNHDDQKVLAVPIEQIRVNHMQPRTEFSAEHIAELADSIRQHGVLQPLLVRRDPSNKDGFQLIAGERRLRASKQVPLDTVPCIFLDTKESEMLEIALIENIQRSNLNPVEEARAYRLMSEQSNLTQDEIAYRVGKSRTAIANSIRLLNLSKTALSALEEGLISSGHAKCLLGIKSTPEMDKLTQEIIANELSVREVEKRIKAKESTQHVIENQPPKPVPPKDNHIQDLQRHLESNWNTKVQLKMSGKNKGKIEIQFYDLDHLDDLLKKWNIRFG